MKITCTGHAGLLISSSDGPTILCDPWQAPAYFASWFVFPDNSGIDFAALQPDYLYVSHLHKDHFDAETLAKLPRSTSVLLPEYPTDDLRDALVALGFTNFVQTENGRPIELDGFRLMIATESSPADGPLGDSSLSVDDGTACVLNQNDSRPRSLDQINAFGAYDGHFLQYSGAIWWPMVYDLGEATKQAVGARKRENGMARALRFIEAVGATYVFPNSGPPAFLDDALFQYNDFNRAAENPFPDQAAMLDWLTEHGHTNGRLLIPASSVTLGPDGACNVEHPMSDAEVASIFTAKPSYLSNYASRQHSRIAAEKAAWPKYEGNLAEALADWWDPLLELADHIGPGVGGPVLLDFGDEQVVIDFVGRHVRPFAGEDCRYKFRIDRALVEALVATKEIDWVNSLFLSLRFGASRKGAYNEFIYTFFKCLAPDRLSYAEGWYADKDEPDELVRIGDYMVQRRCPHLKADLARFGEVQGGVLQCGMHGWCFELATGKCLTSDGHHLVAIPVSEAGSSRSE